MAATNLAEEGTSADAQGITGQSCRVRQASSIQINYILDTLTPLGSFQTSTHDITFPSMTVSVSAHI